MANIGVHAYYGPMPLRALRSGSLGVFVAFATASGVPVGGTNGIVATVHPLASDAAVRAFQHGGNAIDAAVAAALTLGVVDGHNSGIGGGCFMLIRTATGTFVALDGRETAPARATRDMFVREGKADPKLSQTGALAAGVPGALAVYEHAINQYGRLSLESHLLAAAGIAEKGFPIDHTYANRLAATAPELREFGESRKTFLKSDSSPWRAGEVLRLPDLAGSYRAIAEQGTGWFYKGEFARATGAWMGKHGGLVVEQDFKNYKIARRDPVRSRYRGHDIVGFPPPTSGGVHLAQILNILEEFDVKSMRPGSAEFIHVVTEAMKLAFADRAHWLGDPDFVPVPRGLVSKKYAVQLAQRIHLDRATPVPQYATPANATSDVFQKHTTHFSTADRDGNWVACTATINTSFGSKVVVPGTGVVLNNQMDDFSIQPGVSNYFGLLGAEANAVAPGKRPLSSMSPTIVLKNGKPVFSVGAAGGPTIISQTLLAIVNVIDFRMNIESALKEPRFHHQWKPDELRIERRVPPEVRAELEKRGHKLNVVDSMGAAQAVGVEKEKLTGVADPRGEGKAGGY
jgi:gamma-glutamyltranspeptidase / glutathione hydrolase